MSSFANYALVVSEMVVICVLSFTICALRMFWCSGMFYASFFRLARFVDSFDILLLMSSRLELTYVS